MRLLVGFKKLSEEAQIPTKAHKTDGGWDLYASEIEHEGSTTLVRLGFGMKVPEGWCARIAPRSSFTKLGWALTNSPALIDCSYTGEVMLRFTSISEKDFPYTVGNRVAQMTFEEVPEVIWQEVDNLEDTDRGEGGFGSSGK
jgi:dUTP pyrophosphatase